MTVPINGFLTFLITAIKQYRAYLCGMSIDSFQVRICKHNYLQASQNISACICTCEELPYRSIVSCESEAQEAAAEVTDMDTASVETTCFWIGKDKNINIQAPETALVTSTSDS